MIKLTLSSGLDMTLSNIIFAPRYNFNFISLGQQREARNLYCNHPKNMILKKAEIIIDLA